MYLYYYCYCNVSLSLYIYIYIYIYTYVYIPKDGQQNWQPSEQRECRFVFIGKNMKQKHAEQLRPPRMGVSIPFQPKPAFMGRGRSFWKRVDGLLMLV